MNKMRHFLVVLVFWVVEASANNEMIKNSIEEALKQKLGDQNISLEVECAKGSISSKAREQDVTSVVIEKFDPKYSTFQAAINYEQGGKELVSGKYAAFTEVPVAARYIKFGEIIGDDAIGYVKTRIDLLRPGFAASEQEVLGKQAKRYIAAGTMFNKGDVVSPPVIKNNDPVNIIYSSGVIKLKTMGVAMGSGAVGEMIKVKNGDTGAVLLGQIVNKNTVQIGGDQ